MTLTSIQRLRLVRLCAGIQCTLAIAIGFFGSAIAIFSAATATGEPDDWSGLGVVLGAYAAVLGFGSAVLLFVLARRLEYPGSRRGLLVVEVLIAAGGLSHHLPIPLLLGGVLPAAVATVLLGVIEGAGRQQ